MYGVISAGLSAYHEQSGRFLIPATRRSLGTRSLAAVSHSPVDLVTATPYPKSGVERLSCAIVAYNTDGSHDVWELEDPSIITS